ncbi:YidH family protein [Antrihabitans cavernicola]|uniref:DUF202 domain-containing protein n=1 Tax=Antrihabitans cavernicola TaxID=2495913 RepID=A0A5A7S9E8_9NOCA|nr:DUF202 domain-containing protein [Spelaeibacter cavernicola]KAA0022104.1 DUF202 domain-containing protein [Spelaeibacter cavernicola]
MSAANRPDERFTLANERTFLAWMRTALGLVAAGIAVIVLVPGFSTGWVRTLIGLVLVLLGSAAALLGIRRWRQVRRAIEEGAEMPSSVPLEIFAGTVAAVGIFAAGATVVSTLIH